jgi:hypothetical protein
MVEPEKQWLHLRSITGTYGFAERSRQLSSQTWQVTGIESPESWRGF